MLITHFNVNVQMCMFIHKKLNSAVDADYFFQNPIFNFLQQYTLERIQKAERMGMSAQWIEMG